MSSRLATSRTSSALHRSVAPARDQVVANPSSAPNYGRKPRRSQMPSRAEDFRVTVSFPSPLPVLDSELRAIEILLGIDVKELLAENFTNQSKSNAT
ncbi:MAG: hypothetical protein J0H40_23690 [Rhizobiales bacterium]|nr:hypothetical protein [Hyphomicrobiales bacterium]